ncbi:hypothetical protein KPATCC21470_0688 [Kitasatospora purpeofusca]
MRGELPDGSGSPWPQTTTGGGDTHLRRRVLGLATDLPSAAYRCGSAPEFDRTSPDGGVRT